ncbi:MAG: hypothetical protein ABW352_18080 [Polyangiales bacterium]
MGMMRAWIAGAVLGLCCVARADETVAQVERLLGAGPEPAVVHDRIVALGSAGEQALWELYEDTSKSDVVRLRALSELSLFPTPRTASGLAALVRAPATGRTAMELRRALDGLTTLAETVPTGLAAGDLQHLLTHANAHVRKSAAKLLGVIDRGDVEGALAALAQRDPSRMVRATAQRAQTVRASRLR